MSISSRYSSCQYCDSPEIWQTVSTPRFHGAVAQEVTVVVHFAEGKGQHRPMTRPCGRLGAYQFIHGIRHWTSAPDSRWVHDCLSRVTQKKIIIAHRQAQNSPRPERKAYEELVPRHNSNRFLYCREPPRLLKSFDPTREAYVKLSCISNS